MDQKLIHIGPEIWSVFAGSGFLSSWIGSSLIQMVTHFDPFWIIGRNQLKWHQSNFKKYFFVCSTFFRILFLNLWFDKTRIVQRKNVLWYSIQSDYFCQKYFFDKIYRWPINVHVWYFMGPKSETHNQACALETKSITNFRSVKYALDWFVQTSMHYYVKTQEIRHFCIMFFQIMSGRLSSYRPFLQNSNSNL